jgi:hypothetical protein
MLLSIDLFSNTDITVDHFILQIKLDHEANIRIMY